jgi:hypothetical protein
MKMFIIYEYASCVLVAMTVAGLAVAAYAIYPLLKAGHGIMARSLHQFLHGTSWLTRAGLATRVRKP